MNLHRSLMISLCLTGLSFVAQAETPEHCQNHAYELAEQAGQSIFPEMSAQQRSELEQLASKICARHSQSVAGQTGEGRDSDTDDDQGGDWFSARLMKGEPADKPGNRRLERRRMQ